MKAIRAILFGLAIVASLPALAGPQADALSACLADHTSGKDRKDLAKWIFLAMAAHPELSEISAVTDQAKLRSDQFMGRLLTRLVSEDCVKEAKDAMEKEGGSAMKSAFSALGSLAMQELMSNPAVNTSISTFEAHVDQDKIRAAVSGK